MLVWFSHAVPLHSENPLDDSSSSVELAGGLFGVESFEREAASERLVHTLQAAGVAVGELWGKSLIASELMSLEPEVEERSARTCFSG